jgi:hypothetical protein
MSERGTEVALFDYALGNVNILRGKSFIGVNIDKVYDDEVLKKFQAKFRVFLYKSPHKLVSFIKANGIELIYQITSGKKENTITDIIPTFVHCVFTTAEKYGDIYCPISDYLNKYYRTKHPVLPHIVKKFPGSNQTLRDNLGIPHTAVVFGGYGGKDSFNIPFVKDVIQNIARNHGNIYFLFLNFTKFTNENLDNILFLPKNTDIPYKESFINTCDAMIHARLDGETFGLSVAEFSVKNKPIITWKPSIFKNFYFVFKTVVFFILGRGHLYAKAHLNFLGKKGIYYSSPGDLHNILINFRKKYLKKINYDCYSERFSEKSVMLLFSEIINNYKKKKQ